MTFRTDSRFLSPANNWVKLTPFEARLCTMSRFLPRFFSQWMNNFLIQFYLFVSSQVLVLICFWAVTTPCFYCRMIWISYMWYVYCLWCLERIFNLHETLAISFNVFVFRLKCWGKLTLVGSIVRWFQTPWMVRAAAVVGWDQEKSPSVLICALMDKLSHLTCVIPTMLRNGPSSCSFISFGYFHV